MSPLIISLFAFATVAGLAWAIAGWAGVGAGVSRQRFLRYAGDPVAVVDMSTTGGPAVRLPKPWEAFLEKAGIDWSASKAAQMAALHMVAGLAIAFPLNLAPLGAVGGLVAMWIRLRMAQQRRSVKMAAQLPDALMLMATALRSGLGFQQALQLVADEGPSPLAPELGRFSRDLALGLSMEEALVRLQTRLGSTDGEMLAAALLVQRQTGGNLVEILSNLHDTIRDRQQVQGQVRTLTAQGRLSGMVLTAIPIFLALAFWVLNRDYLLVLVHDPRGRMLSGIAIGLMLIGVYFIRRIVRITL